MNKGLFLIANAYDDPASGPNYAMCIDGLMLVGHRARQLHHS